jgi:hypothetical protein
MADDVSGIKGEVVVELRGPDGELKAREVVHNLVSDIGDFVYAQRGSGVASPSAAPTGMKLGTGSTAVAKNGAGAALVTYLTNSHQGFDSGYPTVASAAGAGATVSYRVTYAAGKATSAGAITECVIVNDAIADATSTAAATVSRVLLTGIGSKGASDTLTVTWTHKLLGS